MLLGWLSSSLKELEKSSVQIQGFRRRGRTGPEIGTCHGSMMTIGVSAKGLADNQM